MELSDSSGSFDVQPLSQDEEKALASERIRLAFGNNLYLYLSAVSLALVTAISHWRYNPPYLTLSWLGLIAAVYSGRHIICLMYSRANPGPGETGPWVRRLYAGSLLGGAAWGVGFFLLFAADSHQLQLFMVVALAGLSITSALGFASQITAAALFFVPASLLLSARFFMTGAEHGAPVGVSIIIGLTAFIMTSQRLQASVVNSLKLKFENSQLLSRLDAANQRFKSLSDASFEGILIHHDGIVVDANKTLLKTFGYQNLGSIQGRSLLEFIAEEHRSKALEHIKSGSTEPYEITIFMGDGAAVPVEVQGKPMPYQGKIMRVAAVRNLTERVQAEKRLRSANIFLQTIVDAIPNPIFYKDAAGIYTGCNAAFEKFLGKRREEIVGKSVFDLSPKDLAEKYYQMDQDLFLQGGVQVYESQVARPGGVYKNVIFYKACFHQPSGALGGLVGVILDITDLKETQKELTEAKERAEEATKVKDKFVSLAAHDLRSPISTIENIAGLIVKAEGSAISLKHAELLKRVGGMCGNMIDMIDNLLNITRLSSGFMRPSKRQADARRIAAGAMESVSMAAELKGVAVKNAVPDGMTLFCDPFLISEAMRNLLTNAVKFSNGGSQVTILAREDDGRQILTVRDEGVGTPESMLQNLFRHDVKTCLPGTAGERGSGFGLPLSMDIMRAHGGTITVETSEGKGSSFSLIFSHASQPSP